MTKAQVRYSAHTALEHIEWINKHAASRQPNDARKLEYALADLRKAMLKMIGTYTSDSVPASADRDMEDELKPRP